VWRCFVLDFTFNVTADLAKLGLILQELQKMIVELEDLKTKVTELESASEAAVGLLGLIKTKLDEAVANAATLEELREGVAEVANRIDQEKQDLADAVVANTPAA
jgi:soluble cytochrome b562